MALQANIKEKYILVHITLLTARLMEWREIQNSSLGADSL